MNSEGLFDTENWMMLRIQLFFIRGINYILKYFQI